MSFLEGAGWHQESLFCGTPAKKMQNLQPSASKIIILWLRYYQDSQIVTIIDPKLLISKVINQKTLISEKDN